MGVTRPRPQSVEGSEDALEAGLGRLVGAVVHGLRRLSGGASRELWEFEAGGERFVVRRDPPGRRGVPEAMAREAEIMRACRAAGLQVPEVYAVDDGRLLGTPGVVMAHVAGETVPRRILRDEGHAPARRVLARQMAEFLAALHALDPADVPSAELVDPLEQHWTEYRSLPGASPTFEAAYRWLEQNRPPRAEPRLVHGDFRLGNVIVGPVGVRAVIDWELVHVGDPVEDLAWMCVKAWRFGDRLPAAGLGSVEDLVADYEGAGGRPIDLASFRWWLVEKTLQWGIICLSQAAASRSSRSPSIELAAVGRRVPEQEWDLLELLAPGALADVPERRASAVDRARPPTFGTPAAPELLASARALLTDLASDPGTPQAYLVRVTANAMAIVQRELEDGPACAEDIRICLERLGAGSMTEACDLIRSGRFDDEPDLLHRTLAEVVHARLVVNNPRHVNRRRSPAQSEERQ